MTMLQQLNYVWKIEVPYLSSKPVLACIKVDGKKCNILDQENIIHCMINEFYYYILHSVRESCNFKVLTEEENIIPSTEQTV